MSPPNGPGQGRYCSSTFVTCPPTTVSQYGNGVYRLVLTCQVVEPAETLPNTRALDWPEADLSDRLMERAHTFIERKIAEAPRQRAQFWHRDFSSAVAYSASIEPNRQHFRTIIGAVVGW